LTCGPAEMRIVDVEFYSPTSAAGCAPMSSARWDPHDLSGSRADRTWRAGPRGPGRGEQQAAGVIFLKSRGCRSMRNYGLFWDGRRSTGVLRRPRSWRGRRYFVHRGGGLVRGGIVAAGWLARYRIASSCTTRQYRRLCAALVPQRLASHERIGFLPGTAIYGALFCEVRYGRLPMGLRSRSGYARLVCGSMQRYRWGSRSRGIFASLRDEDLRRQLLRQCGRCRTRASHCSRLGHFHGESACWPLVVDAVARAGTTADQTDPAGHGQPRWCKTIERRIGGSPHMRMFAPVMTAGGWRQDHGGDADPRVGGRAVPDCGRVRAMASRGVVARTPGAAKCT
jgi:alpha-1,6-mannosyltransferase